MQEARNALQEVLPDLDQYLREKSIEVIGHEWFLNGGESSLATLIVGTPTDILEISLEQMLFAGATIPDNQTRACLC